MFLLGQSCRGGLLQRVDRLRMLVAHVSKLLCETLASVPQLRFCLFRASARLGGKGLNHFGVVLAFGSELLFQLLD